MQAEREKRFEAEKGRRTSEARVADVERELVEISPRSDELGANATQVKSVSEGLAACLRAAEAERGQARLEHKKPRVGQRKPSVGHRKQSAGQRKPSVASNGRRSPCVAWANGFQALLVCCAALQSWCFGQ
jgi:hypothetical protein